MQNVLDSVVSSLLRDSNRKFVFAEMVSSFLPVLITGIHSFVRVSRMSTFNKSIS